jgi:hypothetical protein
VPGLGNGVVICINFSTQAVNHCDVVLGIDLLPANQASPRALKVSQPPLMPANLTFSTTSPSLGSLMGTWSKKDARVSA